MSVIIKTLDLPSNCDECWFSKWSNYHQTACCRLNDYKPVAEDFSRDYKQKRADFCPIEPWPEHTMRCKYCDMSICTLEDKPCSGKVME